MSTAPKRGMFRGQWYRDLETLPDRGADIETSFETPASRVKPEIQRLRDRPGSYHLFAAKACPFAHRVLLMLANLPQPALGITYCHPWLGGPEGWSFAPGSAPPVGEDVLWKVYAASDPAYSGRITVPVLWDKTAGAIASADSLEIMQALAAAYRPEMCPEDAAFAKLCIWIHQHLNIGVYKVGFAADQAAYNAAVDALDSAMDKVAELVASGFAFGTSPTIADLMIFATGIRFDIAYHGAFQILHRRWGGNKALQQHLERIAALPGVEDTLAFQDYRVHYFDEAGFPVRQPMSTGRYILPRTCDPL
ncbi:MULTISPECIES: glutathione S-transferase C-terminal domain-containing protein [unclassified Leisingera]|uniref:glutathione S-transferase C-terminal domain-containing protein n=1 Tax=unclassified Leisingera TaxID=2614906 RepID=UPI00138DD11A|nr:MULTISPECIES: glutathione S-transferase C-terminal domain-containing protein [unclassified Leisingera]